VALIGYVLWLKGKLLGFQGFIPSLDNLCDLARAVGSREEGSFCNALGLYEYLNTAIRITDEVGGLESYIILSVDLCVSGHTLEGFQVSARAVEKQLRVVVCALLEAALCQAEEAGHQCNVTYLPPFVGTLLFLSDVESILNSV
jgi:hypothetical protein